MRRALLVIPLLFFFEPARADDDPPDERFERDMAVRFHMHQNFDLLRSIERLLVRGQLELAQDLARTIGWAPDDDELGPWSAYVSFVRERAMSVATAPTINEALRRHAKLAAACAGCHSEAGAEPELDTTPAPLDKATIPSRMARHVWATGKLFEGIVADSPDAWRAGVDLLAATPLPWRDLDATRAPYGRRLQQQAREAKEQAATDNLFARTRRYGDILVTCASCHRVR